MAQGITFTPSDVVTMVLAVGAGIITMSSAVGAIVGWANKIRQPEVKQNERITKLEERVDNHDELLKEHKVFFTNDDERLKQIEESNRITQKGMLALLKHSINGADVETLRKAEADLEEYLISKD